MDHCVKNVPTKFQEIVLNRIESTTEITLEGI